MPAILVRRRAIGAASWDGRAQVAGQVPSRAIRRGQVQLVCGAACSSHVGGTCSVVLMFASSDSDRPDSASDGDPATVARIAAARFAELSGVAAHDVAVVLGSGWTAAVGELGSTVAEIAGAQLPGFPQPSVPGHAGVVRSVALAGGRRALVFVGRTHVYEDRGVDPVVHPVRVAAAAGARLIVLTNGCGSLVPSWMPGTPVLISDHLNLSGATPLRGPTFVDLTDLYSARLRALCRQLDPSLPEGVYAQFRGPQYETPAEVRMAGVLGAQLVGMSTAVEAIAAREAGLEVLGISLVTNLAAGLSGATIDHREVLEVGSHSAPGLGRLLARVLPAA
jgi:purine-nucleoside phosphorylase